MTESFARWRENDIHFTLDKWVIEATSSHNDGYTQQHYRDELQGVYDRLNQLGFILKDKNGKSN